MLNKTPVFIVGATSFVGMHLLNELKKNANYSIKIMTRSREKLPRAMKLESAIEVVEGDLLKPGSLSELMEPGCIVINLAYNREASVKKNLLLINNLMKVCKTAKINRLIHVSTADVFGRNNNDVILEDMPCQPVTSYAITKLKIESILLSERKNDFDTVILRPTAIFGANGANLIKLANEIMSKGRFRNYLKSCLFGKRQMNLVAIENVISSLNLLIDYTGSFKGEVFNISDDDDPANNYSSVETMLKKELGADKYPWPKFELPSIVLSFILRCLCRDNIHTNRVYSSEKIANLGYKKEVLFETAIINFAAWYSSVQVSNKL